MNRTFLIFLMVGSALMIAVLGQYKPTTHLNYAPWDIRIQQNGASRVFGITLEKTNIQEANQIFARFAKTQLVINPQEAPELEAHYSELNMNGIIGDLYLSYQLDKQTLNDLSSGIIIPRSKDGMTAEETKYDIPADREADFLATTIKRIRYIPYIRFGEEIITQHFGAPQNAIVISDSERHWLYPQSGLLIKLFNDQPEQFIYSPITQE